MAKLDDLALTADQRSQIETALTDGTSNMAIVRRLASWGYNLSEKSIRRYRRHLGEVVLEAPRTLLIDIETTPNLVYAWRLFKETIGVNQIVEPSRVLCFAAKWLGDKSMMFHSEGGWRSEHEHMIRAAHDLLDEADVVCHYNGQSFDIPHLNREFVEIGLAPPSPFKQIDLLLTVRKQFLFPSNKLAHVSVELGLEGKVAHEGFELWTKCMAYDPAAWKRMEKYNKRDVELLEELYDHLQPWIVSHPSHAVFTGNNVCPACGSAELIRKGFAYTNVSSFPRYQCKSCGKYSRGTHRLYGVEITSVA